MARFRSSPSSKVVATSASEAGTSAAPPTPCNRRAATSPQGAHASPPNREAAANKGEPVYEQAPPTVKVAGAAHKEQEAPKGERVTGEDPLHVAPRET